MKSGEQMFKTSTAACDNQKCEWAHYARILFPPCDSSKELIDYSFQQQIVCSPNVNSMIRKKECFQNSQREATEEENAFDDFLKGVVDNREKGMKNQNYLLQMFKNTASRRMNSQTASEEQIDNNGQELRECTNLLKEFYNKQYVELGKHEVMQHLTGNSCSSRKVIISDPFEFGKRSLSSSETLNKSVCYQSQGVRCMGHFSKEQQCVYIHRQDSCEFIKHVLDGQDYSTTVCVDTAAQKFFLYNNITNQICVFALKTGRSICRLKSFVQRSNPSLYFYEKTRHLLVIGGFEYLGKQMISSQKVQIYKMESNTTQLQPTILNLHMGRLKPIVSQFCLHNSNYMLIIGGIKKAVMFGPNLIYEETSQENKKTNSTAEVINMEQLSHRLLNISGEPLKLNSGYNIIYKRQLLTIVPCCPSPLKFSLCSPGKDALELRIQVVRILQQQLLDHYKIFDIKAKPIPNQKSLWQAIESKEKEEITSRGGYPTSKPCCPLI